MPEMVACAAFGEVARMDFVIITNTDSLGSGRLCAGNTAKRQLRRSSSVRVQFKTEFLLGGGEFEFSSISSSIQYSTSARGGRKCEFSSSSSSVRIQFEFSSSSVRSSFFCGGEGGSSSSVRVRVQFDILLLLGEGGIRVRVQFEFSSNSVRDRVFSSKFIFLWGGGGEFEFRSSSSSIRYSTSARGGRKFEFSSSSSLVRVQFEREFSWSSVPSFFFRREGGVRIQFEFFLGWRTGDRAQFEFEFSSSSFPSLFFRWGGGEFEFSSSSVGVH